MAVTPTQLSDVNELAKDYFSNVYTVTVNTRTALKAQFAGLQAINFTGRKWIFGTKLDIGGGSANVGANFSLPAAKQGVYQHGEMTLVRTYTRMGIDNFAIEVTKQAGGSFKPALAEVMEDRLTAHDLEVNRQMFCNGTGVLAVILTGATSTTQTLSNDYGVTNGGAGARHLYPGDQIALYSSDLMTKRSTHTVSSVDHSGQTVVLGTSATSTTGDVIARATSDTDNVVAGEAIGLLASVKDSGSLHTISGAGRWLSTRYTNAGVKRDLTDALVLQLVSEVAAKSGKVPNLAVTRTGVVLKYSETFLPIRRIMGVGGDAELKGGYKPINGLQYGGGVIPVLEDLDCPESRVFFLNTDALRMADLIGTGWFDGDGAQFFRVQDKDAIEGYIRKYWGLATIQRNANGVIEDLNDISTISRV